MPRTKIPKNSKRNREAANREEKIRIYELKSDSFLEGLDEIAMRYKTIADTEIELIQSRLQSELRTMKMGDFIDQLTQLERFNDFKASDQTQQFGSHSICSNKTIGTVGNISNINSAMTATSSRNDEGYLTEDSGLGGGIGSQSGSIISAYGSGTIPGPLHSARARRERRSRSACEGSKVLAASTKSTSSIMASATKSHRNSRNKMRTPMPARQKAYSAERTPCKQRGTSPGTPPMAFMRWPKPGEMALSKFGSPMVAQVMPDKFANVNIPIRNGVLSLRPKKLAEVHADLIENLDSDTLNQIRTLHENLQMIVNTASKAGLK